MRKENRVTTPETSHSTKVIAIVGGGLSGALVAIQLLRQATSPLQVALIEPRAEVGQGIAYSTASPAHLLNVRAGNMSIFPEAPEDFLSYLRSSGSPDYSGRDFVRRQYFGVYVGERLQQARSEVSYGVGFEHIRDRARRIDLGDDGRAQVALDGGSVFTADVVVLALGNNPPAIPFENSAGTAVVSGWSAAAFSDLAKDEAVLIVGTGLTAVDAVLALEDRNHRGAIHVISRHGRWPLVHGSPPPSREAPLVVGQSNSVLSILRTLRAKARQAGVAEASWQVAFDQIRPHTNLIWRRFPATERRRFLRHARPLWEIHRHRMPPAAAARIESLNQSGQLITHRGRVLSAARTRDGFTEVTIVAADRNEKWQLAVRRVIVCTGPDLDFRRATQPIIRDLIGHNLAQLDSNNLGLLVSDDCALIPPGGASSSFFALGPVIKGSLWETTALPEIRVQARDLAAHLLDTIGNPANSGSIPNLLPT